MPGKNSPHPAFGHPLPATTGRGDSELYTCPMHPEILRDGPGFCPICGMALEPRVATLDDQPNPELIDMRRRFIVCAILTVPIMFLGMRGPLVQLVLSTPVVLWGAWPFFVRGVRSLNMFTLIAIGLSTPFIFTVVSPFISAPPS